MESLSSSAAIVPSTSSSLSFFSPVRKDSPPRFIRIHTSSKKEGNESDLRSDSNESSSIVPFFNKPTFSDEDAMGLVLSAASVRGGWTTGSGMEGPSAPVGEVGSGTDKVSTFPWSLFTKSPRRRMRVAFTCNVCGQRTTRAINPHAYAEGTVFVQCCGCNVFHKLVDHLNLFHEMKCYVSPSFNYRNGNLPELQSDVGFKFFDFHGDEEGEDRSNDVFPF